VQDLDFEPDAFIEPDFDWSLTDTTHRVSSSADHRIDHLLMASRRRSTALFGRSFSDRLYSSAAWRLLLRDQGPAPAERDPCVCKQGQPDPVHGKCQ